MATAEVASRPPERPMKRKPFANFIRKLGIKGSDQHEKANNSKKSNGGGIALKSKKNAPGKNNPYPESGQLPQQQASQPSFGDSSRHHYSSSFASLPPSAGQDRDGPSHSNKSGAPTLATNPETIHSDAGHSRAATTTTGAGALSSMDGAGANSTFSSPNQSEHSLATTLTTIQSTSNPAPAGTNGVSGHNSAHNHQSQPMGSNFSHQYPVSPSHSASMASAIPRHLQGENPPNTYNSATANNLLTDNASILTLASSSKRRRRSMDTDASVRALAPSSVFGGSRESLPLSVLSGNVGSSSEAPPRHSVTGAAAERASVYSSSGLVRDNFVSSALTSERNSYYAKPAQASDAKSLRSISNLKRDEDKASITGVYARSDYGDAKSLNAGGGDVASLRSVGVGNTEGHARNGSIPGSIGSPVNTPSLLRQTSTGGTALSVSRRSSDWRELDADGTTEVDLNGVEDVKKE
ncbi:hypothetical protein M409DRAFT_60572 [Zasmidium cellare ATCC 36951]|uniref:Uncharacterized protein n=1 Tax=Zasmidium cellare ATCC 36951 TaxID=1080233 RepID=A0A6A6BYC7_ZASCE|nr:uncharacterized protein M409DRAFT_60572 [Zasmidium cellare ATCC 36951]KAF2159807.1 hypothetical protein M409DRAFT_60572 [Zasmidium cellare ATCC 36951]